MSVQIISPTAVGIRDYLQSLTVITGMGHGQAGIPKDHIECAFDAEAVNSEIDTPQVRICFMGSPIENMLSQQVLYQMAFQVWLIEHQPVEEEEKLTGSVTDAGMYQRIEILIEQLRQFSAPLSGFYHGSGQLVKGLPIDIGKPERFQPANVEVSEDSVSGAWRRVPITMHYQCYLQAEDAA